MQPLKTTLVMAIATSVLGVAHAHMTVISNEASAGWYYDAVIGVPHGCADPSSTKANPKPNWDTYKVEIKIPKSFLKPRTYDAKFGKGSVTETADAYVLTWVRDENYPEYETDSHAYALQFKTKLPKGDYATYYFPSVQYCHKNGVETQSAWVDTSGVHGHGHSVLPAPKLVAYPKNRYTGWNKFTVTQAITHMSVFDNAAIVWYGNAAYSKNPVTAEMIKNDKSVTELTQIPANATIWVKY